MTNVRSLDDRAHDGLMTFVTAERDANHTPATSGCSSLSHASKDAWGLRARIPHTSILPNLVNRGSKIRINP
jgi:hypothetical protein